MEPTTPFYRKKSFWAILANVGISLFVVVIVTHTTIRYIKKINTALKEVQQQLVIADSTKATNEAEIVALRAELELYSDNKVLYTAVTDFNKVVSKLKYHEGDIVYCKPDSTKAVIFGVTIGGSKYNYYVKYRVETKFDGEVHELYPQEIY